MTVPGCLIFEWIILSFLYQSHENLCYFFSDLAAWLRIVGHDLGSHRKCRLLPGELKQFNQ